MDDINFFVLKFKLSKFKSGFCHWTVADLTIDLNLQTKRNFPTSAKLSNFRLSNFRLSILKLSNFSFFPTALYTILRQVSF